MILLLVPLFLLLLVGLTLTLRGMERRWPAFSRWLDRHWPEPDWTRPW